MGDNSGSNQVATTKKGLGLLGLIAIVFGSMVGGGIFNIAQNMASAAGLGAVIIAWAITGFGMVFLVLTFKILSDRCPDLNEGIYQYAREGFGNYIGFNIAWGYWLCVALGNVAFAVMLNDSLGGFFPVFLKHSWPTLIFCISLVWFMFFIVIHGVMTASFINTVMTILKFTAIILIIAVLFFYMRSEMFTNDFWGEKYSHGYKPLGSIGNQVMGTMLVTMFCFVGVEGAVMLSSYARNHKDVGKASVIGFYLALVIYALISILCFGVRTQPELAGMKDPSVAYVLKAICGEWGYYFVICTVIVSLLSAFVAWTLLCAQTPYGAAKVHILPEFFIKTNRHDVPVYGLGAATVFMSLFIVLVCTAPNVYMAALNLTTIMVLPAYAFSGAYLWKASCQRGALQGSLSGKQIIKYRWIGIICTLYCLWCIYAGGILLFLSSSILYLIGFYFYYQTNRQNSHREGKKLTLLTTGEKFILVGIILASAASIVLLCIGKINLSS